MEDLVAVRIKDGIFAGNAGAAADKTLLIMNKITHIINCAGAEVADFFLGEPGFSYLSFPWKDAAGSVCTTILFDTADDNIHRAVQFIDEALAAGECVLVHSVYGNSRSPALIAAYMIMKYGWKLESALLYLKMAHPDSDIKPHFQRQLRQFAKRHDVDHDIFAQDVDDSQFGLDNDQWMLRNTLLNGLLYKDQMANNLYRQCAEKVDVGNPVNGKPTKGRITFVDTKKGTDADSRTTCPVVNRAASFPADPASAEPGSFLGFRGHLCLRTGRRLPSILSRSTSPCSRRLESDPRMCPKGRQSLPVVHSGTTETSTGVLTKGVERVSALRGSGPASSTHSSFSLLEDKPAKGRDREGGPAPPQLQRSSAESARSIDYARLAAPTQLRSPFATLGSSHRYRNGSPLPTPKDKKGTAKESHTRIQSLPASRPGNTTSVTSISIPTSAWASSSFGLSNPTSVRGTPRTSSPLASNRPTRDVVGRPSAASYRGIAPYRSIVAPRTATEPSYCTPRSSNPSPSRRGVDHGTGSRSGSRRRTMSPVYLTAKRSPSGGRTQSGTEDKPRSRARSPKAQKHQDPNSGSLNNSFASIDSNGTSGGANGANSKNTVTVRRQPPSVISSRRQA
ncbi:putative dual specificity protein phosphatase [Leishmania mexicana MHOM/GT/2001/U1103]|uniref:Dual specificity protein phosphatase n=1 Tax=Leishmania mexicana (strain MHOM/GT/2001/U1103) TaxID=929439 RepID=E9AV36_LEIMU|nr:putative dual specificity protein phosphatase [Leishmania mexicana MHOM/GT/2001/U1103]CBZ26817.1 putative dual specificity protein phosphatase [Leishmania mexicana MHOM/GT/2001/U1103]